MRRRDFIALIGGAAATLPPGARAQQSVIPTVGCLAAPAEATYTQHTAAIRQGLKEAGFIDGQNVAFEFRWAEGRYERLPVLAADLVHRKVDVIMTMGGSPPILAAKEATSTIPIVFHLGADPVQLGFVASLNRPGGNITGITLMTNLLEPKRLELLHKMVPKAKSIAFLVNPANPQSNFQTRHLRKAMGSAQFKLAVLGASNQRELEESFARIAEDKVDALSVLADVFLTSNSVQIAALSTRYRIPTIAHSREFAVAGGLMSYGTNLADAYRLAGGYAGRILKGERPADLPVIEPTRFDFLINLRTARLLGLTVPPILLAIADEVIE
jgi:putative ABC transport system substrate-binding protein